MKIVTISGSYRRGKTIDTLIDRAIEGASAGRDDVECEKIRLIDKKIEYCRNCMACRFDDPSKPLARCVIDDDMQSIYPLLDAADGYIIGTPVNMGRETALLKTFTERICWVHSYPGTKPFNGCPMPRNSRKKRAVIIVSSGIIPPFLRRFCDNATSFIKDVCHDSFNAEVPATLYAGDIEGRGVEAYFSKARRLGEWLAI